MSGLNILLLLSLITCASCLKILGVFPFTGRSHFLIFEPLLKELSRRGHEVTVMSSFPLRNPPPGYTDVYLPVHPGGEDMVQLVAGSRWDKYRSPISCKESTRHRCEFLLASEEYRDFLLVDGKYDIILSEYFFFNCHLTPVVKKFKVPYVLIQTTPLMPWANQWAGNPDNPAYIPNWVMDYSHKLGFLERLENTAVWVFGFLYYNYVMVAQEVQMYLKYAGADSDYLYDMMRNTSMFLVYTHFAIHGARPFVPNVIEINGMHIESQKRLPAHIDKWINESKHGVIYFSLGSMIKGHTFPDDKKQMFINAFGRLPQRVLWKWENETMPGKTDNIMIEKWMPQFDILCHPNVKAFIAHGGMLGVTEAVHCGVPMIIMPQFGDQFTNAKAVEASGGGTILDYRYLDEESIYNALTTALDPKSNKKAKELSARFKDRPLPPLETAIYWIEYVARHGGAPHLRTAAVGMPLYQYLLLDVIAFLVVILFSFLFVVYYISRAILRKLCRRKQSSQKKKKH
uniref:UDP-glucuronosyltransferase n=1 Tax=Photinus pyralis TaxID=7054 RepID=A0A1Y1LL43_PHOPY